MDATVYSVTTGGLSKKQIDETPIAEGLHLSLLSALVSFPIARLQHLLSKARRHP